MKMTILVAVLAAATPTGWTLAAQRVPQTGDPLMDYRLRASRAERAQAQLARDADELDELARSLATRVGASGTVESDDVKSVTRIRKLAKRVRTAMGSVGDARMESPPATARDAALALGDRSESLVTEIHAATRFEMNARIVTIAGEIVVLTNLIEGARKRQQHARDDE